jgi:Fe-S cluster biogenesis protein NfuA
MESHDDPEARIRDLERPLADRARTSELGANPYPYPTQPYSADPYPPPPPMTGPLPPMPVPVGGYGAPYPVPPQRPGSGSRAALLLAIPALVVGAIIAVGIAVWFSDTVTDTRSMIESITGTPSADPSISIDIPPIVIPGVEVPDVGAPGTPVAPGDVVSVAGVGANRTLVCDGGNITVSGVDNVVVLTGTCSTVSVSGVRNEVRIESVSAISVSGFDNTVTYRNGTPEKQQSGSGNSIEQG